MQHSPAVVIKYFLVSVKRINTRVYDYGTASEEVKKMAGCKTADKKADVKPADKKADVKPDAKKPKK